LIWLRLDSSNALNHRCSTAIDEAAAIFLRPTF